MKDPWWRLGAAYVVLLLFLGASIWEGHPGAAARVLLPMTLAFNVLASRRGAALAWLLLGNLTVPAGLLAMIEVPVDAREVAALRAHGIASVARADGGWYNVEHSLRHSWVWTEGGGGALAVESWPRVTRILELEFSTRSLTPRTLEVREGDAVLWRGAIGPDYRVVSLRFAVTRGRAELAFASDAAAVATGEGPSARPLAFNLRDVRITAPKTSQSPPASAGTGPR